MGLILGAVLLTLGVILFLLVPILRGEWASLRRSDEEPTELASRKRVALKGLRDAEYDYRSGKLDEEDYRALKAEMSLEALAAMEEVRTEAASRAAPAAAEGRLVPAGGGSPSVSGQDPLEQEIAQARRRLAEGRMCSECGYAKVDGSRFCAGCGRPLGDAPRPKRRLAP